MKKSKGSGHHDDQTVPNGADAGPAEAAVNEDGNSTENAAEPAAAESAEQLREALTAREKDFQDLSEKYLRLAAEYDNFRKRSQKEKESIYSDAIISVVKDMLPVVDNIVRAGQAAAGYDTEEARKVAEGVDLIARQIDQVLDRLHVCRIECVGQPFDPELHEAVMHVEDENVGPSTVVEELQTGYRRDTRVIRHSVVKVAN